MCLCLHKLETLNKYAKLSTTAFLRELNGTLYFPVTYKILTSLISVKLPENKFYNCFNRQSSLK